MYNAFEQEKGGFYLGTSLLSRMCSNDRKARRAPMICMVVSGDAFTVESQLPEFLTLLEEPLNMCIDSEFGVSEGLSYIPIR